MAGRPVVALWFFSAQCLMPLRSVRTTRSVRWSRRRRDMACLMSQHAIRATSHFISKRACQDRYRLGGRWPLRRSHSQASPLHERSQAFETGRKARPTRGSASPGVSAAARNRVPAGRGRGSRFAGGGDCLRATPRAVDPRVANTAQLDRPRFREASEAPVGSTARCGLVTRLPHRTTISGNPDPVQAQ